MLPPRDFVRAEHEQPARLSLRRPVTGDGPAITALIAACPPLDANSAYCNLLQCTHFADSCIISERDGRIMGWVSAYRPPSEPDSLFVWQVAVAPAARGEGLGKRMISALLDRPGVRGVARIITTVTPDNLASWALFEGLARSIGATLSRQPLFDRDAHFAGAHETEWQATIAPLPAHPCPRVEKPETLTL